MVNITKTKNEESKLPKKVEEKNRKTDVPGPLGNIGSSISVV